MRKGNEQETCAPSSETSPWYDTKKAAAYLIASPKTLAAWRSSGDGPRFHIIGDRLVRYHRDDLDAFVFSGAKGETLPAN